MTKATHPNREFYNLSRNPSSFEGLDIMTGHDIGFHAETLAEEGPPDLEAMRKRNPQLYALMVAELARAR